MPIEHDQTVHSKNYPKSIYIIFPGRLGFKRTAELYPKIDYFIPYQTFLLKM